MDEVFVAPSEAPDVFLELVATLSQMDGKAKRDYLKRHNGKNFDMLIVEAALEMQSTSASSALFRKTKTADEALRSVWFAEFIRGAKEAALNSNRKRFSGLSSNDIRNIVKTSVDVKSIQFLPRMLLERYGIVLVYNRAYPAMKLDGAAIRLFGEVPAIGLSIRYSRYDNFWFTLSHELSHIALHFEKLDSAIIDDLDEEAKSDVEIEANRYAADAIIPRNLLNKSNAMRSSNDEDIVELARQCEVHPALVAGAIQHHKKNFRLYKDIVGGVNVRAILGIETDD